MFQRSYCLSAKFRTISLKTFEESQNYFILVQLLTTIHHIEQLVIKGTAPLLAICMLKVFAERYPEQLGKLMQYYDELYLLFDTIVESYFLKTCGKF